MTEAKEPRDTQRAKLFGDWTRPADEPVKGSTKTPAPKGKRVAATSAGQEAKQRAAAFAIVEEACRVVQDGGATPTRVVVTVALWGQLNEGVGMAQRRLNLIADHWVDVSVTSEHPTVARAVAYAE